MAGKERTPFEKPGVEDDIIARVVNEAGEGDAVVIMSNGGFGGLHQKLITALS
jgi:UDP-N-acetylmuramate: L-alanyl-gamma-D-glutamyl-meso-diaminopimelate ligase